MTDTVTYVYAVGRGVDALAVAGLVGLADGPVRLVRAGDLQAVVGDVDRAEFEDRALSERLEDLEWLATTARAHHHVVDAVGRAQLVAPLSLATVYFGDERVREVLEAGRETFGRVLDQLEGRSEWGVKAYARPRRSREEDERPQSGAEYLRRRRKALRESDTSLEEAETAAHEVHRALAGLAVDSRTHRLQDTSMTGTSEAMVLNGAYLVPDEEAGELRTLVESRADHDRVRVEITGPWVPYSFSQVGS